MSGDDSKLDLILAEVQAIRRVLEQRERESRLTRDDYAALQALLPAIAAIGADFVFVVGELIDHADVDRSGILAGALATARRSPKGLGKLFARAAGVHVDGLTLNKVRDTREGAVWHVSALFPTQERRTTVDPGRALLLQSTPSQSRPGNR